MELLRAAEAEAAQRCIGGALAARRLQTGERIAVVATVSADLLNLLLAALRLGIVPVVLNPAMLPAELDELIADAEPALVLRENDVAAFAEAENAPVDLAPVPLARPMHYTSGTTGRAKGVWSGVLAEPDAHALCAEERDLWQFGPNDVHLVCSPLHHSAPLRFAAGTLLAGGSVVLPGRFEPRRVAEAIGRFRPTTTFMAPAHLQRLLALPPAAIPRLATFRLVAHAGSVCPEPVKRAALGAFPTGTVWEFYGSTEGQFTACPPADWLERPGTVGRARPGRRLSVDADADAMVWCEVPRHARFVYWHDPDKTAAAWRDGAFTVGDLGRLDDDGFLFLDGRRDDLVISGGVNVYPAEVERVLRQVVGVDDVAVFGVDDERWGQRVCAVIVGAAQPDLVMQYAREHLASYKCPKQVVTVTEIPVSPTGKLRRSTLASDLGLSP